MNGFTESKRISAIAGLAATEGDHRAVESLPPSLRAASQSTGAHGRIEGLALSAQ